MTRRLWIAAAVAILSAQATREAAAYREQDFARQFDAASDRYRIVALLSPT